MHAPRHSKGGGKPTAGRGSRRKDPAALLAGMRERLQGARFRWINEMLYKETGAEALARFQSDKSMFDEYHTGYATQVDKWPEDPLDRVIELVRTLGRDKRAAKARGRKLCVADMGCGVARLAETLLGEAPERYEVHSFDLVACNKHVTACNIASVPLEDESVDVAVYCLSLMGTDYVRFLVEGRRILRDGGTLIIAETKSRIPSVGRFVRGLEALGFERLEADESNKMFVLFQFTKLKDQPPSVTSEHNQRYASKLLALKPCIYKRR